ncbi:MAG: arabinose isomerase, partial [Athalassotoga sp.]
MEKKPKIGLIGIMQELYDDMLPGITERQTNYAKEVAKQLSNVADVVFTVPARVRDDIEKQVKTFNDSDVDGIMIAMLTYSPGMRLVRAFGENHLPVLLANIQPEPTVTDKWDMGDLTYNQGVHGAQDNANALL